VTLDSVRAYREAKAEFAQMRTMDVWSEDVPKDAESSRVGMTIGG
jgi:hypothetical protein